MDNVFLSHLFVFLPSKAIYLRKQLSKRFEDKSTWVLINNPRNWQYHLASISMAYIANAGEGTDSICIWQPIYCHYSQTSSEYNPEINLDFPAYFIWFRKHVQYIRPQFLWVGRLARRQRLSVCYISGLKGLALFAIKYNVNLSHWINVFPPAKRTTNQFLEWDGRILKELSSFKVNFQLDCSTFLKKIGS